MSKAVVYTRGGDKGQTSLVSGTRISKGCEQLDLYGEVDHLNSTIGVAIAHMADDKTFELEVKYLYQVQSRLFDLGSNLACELDKRLEYKLPQLCDELIDEMEEKIDLLDEELEKMTHFILPSGHIASAHLHICRTTCRMVERKLIASEAHGLDELPMNATKFLNRLSDYLFTLSRVVNSRKGIEEQKWIPAATPCK